MCYAEATPKKESRRAHSKNRSGGTNNNNNNNNNNPPQRSKKKKKKQKKLQNNKQIKQKIYAELEAAAGQFLTLRPAEWNGDCSAAGRLRCACLSVCLYLHRVGAANKAGLE